MWRFLFVIFLLAGCSDSPTDPGDMVASEVITPNSTIEAGLWNNHPPPPSPLWWAIENFEETSYAWISGSGGLGSAFVVGLSDFAGPAGATITAVTVRVLYKGYFSGLETCYPTIGIEEINLAGDLPQSATVADNQIGLGGLSLTPAQVNAMALSVSSNGAGWTKTTKLEIYGAWVYLEYIVPATSEIIVKTFCAPSKVYTKAEAGTVKAFVAPSKVKGKVE